MSEAQASTVSTLATGLHLAEGPIACGDGSILVLEVLGGRLTRVGADGKKSVVAPLGGGPNGAAIGPDGRCYIANNGGLTDEDIGRLSGALPPVPEDAPVPALGRIDVVDLHSGDFSTLYDSCDGEHLVAPNDLVFDKAGGFYFTDFGCLQRHRPEPGFLYYATPDGRRIHCVAGPLERANGVGLSPDQRELYVAETSSGRVWAFEITNPGALKTGAGVGCGGRLLCELPGTSFDSLAVEANGFVCVAASNDSFIARISPADGAVTRIEIKAEAGPTNICFGGADLRTAYITTMRTGELLATIWPGPGLKLNYNT